MSTVEAGQGTSVIEKTPEQVAAEEAEGEAAFAAGVSKVTGEETPPAKAEEGAVKAQPTEEKKAADDQAAADAAAKATAEAEAKATKEAEAAKAAQQQNEPWRAAIDKLSGDMASQISKLSGHLGSFKQSLEKITTAASAAAEKKGAEIPTKVEIEEALADPDKWKQLQTDFPEWMGPISSELTRLRKDVAAAMKVAQDRPAPIAPAAPAKAEPIDTGSIIEQAEERAYVRLKHPDWKQICATTAFAKDWLPKQPAEMQAKAASDNAEDAIAVFDAWKAHEKKSADAEAARLKNDKRLQAALPAKGTAEPPAAGISDEEAFERGVKSVVKRA